MSIYIYSSIIILFWFSTVFSYSLENKIEESVDWDTFEKCEKGKLALFSKECSKQYEVVSKILEQCENAIEKKCGFQTIISAQLDEDSLIEKCNSYNQNDCNEIIENGISILPECKNLNKEYMENKNLLVQYNDSMIKFSCAFDEYGNICPLSKYYITDEYLLESIEPEQFLENSINQTCKSNICTEIAYESYSKILKMTTDENLNKRQYNFDSKLSDDKNLENMLEYLKSDNCTSQASYNYPVASNAFTNNNNNILIICLTLILLLLFIKY